MLHEALRLIRVFHDISQSDAAEKLGISKSYLSEIENNKKKPTLDLIGKYSSTFELPVSSIMFFSENIDGNTKLETARTSVASKVIKLMKFLEARSERSHAD